jgi:hypothetical protein
MEVLSITIFCSVLLVLCFVVLFLGNQRNKRSSYEQDALMPLEEGDEPLGPRMQSLVETKQDPNSIPTVHE